MTDKPMTPREDVEFWLTQSMRFMREDGCVPVTVQDKIINLLRTLLAERDETYRRGQEDMRDAVMKAASATQSEILLAAGEMTAQELRTAKAVLAWKQRMIAKLPIKETPDA